jgi:hypothetical protein
LIKITIFCRRHEFLRATHVIGVVGFVSASQGNDRSVMPVVIPESVKIVAALRTSPNHLCFLTFVFREQNDRALACCAPSRSPDRTYNIFLGAIENALRRIKTKPIEMEFLNPVARVGNEKLPY